MVKTRYFINIFHNCGSVVLTTVSGQCSDLHKLYWHKSGVKHLSIDLWTTKNRNHVIDFKFHTLRSVPALIYILLHFVTPLRLQFSEIIHRSTPYHPWPLCPFEHLTSRSLENLHACLPTTIALALNGAACVGLLRLCWSRKSHWVSVFGCRAPFQLDSDTCSVSTVKLNLIPH